MATKKVILATARHLDLRGGGAALKKFNKKAVVVENYEKGDVLSDAIRISGVVRTDINDLKNALTFADLAVIDLGEGDALETDLIALQDAANRKTLLVLAADNLLAFYGLGIDAKKKTIQRAATAQDVVPTIAYIADLTVPDDCTGAVIYQVMKDPGMKAKELAKLKEAIQRMEAALQRDNREPWDKHDCA